MGCVCVGGVQQMSECHTRSAEKQMPQTAGAGWGWGGARVGEVMEEKSLHRHKTGLQRTCQGCLDGGAVRSSAAAAGMLYLCCV